MADGKCFALVRGRVMRVTRLDGCGRIAPSGCSAIVSDGFVTVAYAARVDEGEEINQKNAAGKTCVYEPANPTINGYGVTITFCKVDPELYAMLTGQDVVYDYNGVAVGFQVSTGKNTLDTGFALEVWSGVPGQACDTEGAGGSFGYTLTPFLQGGTLGDFTIENGAVTFTVNNANTKDGNAWGQGPYDVVPTDETGTAGPLLEAIPSNLHLHVQWTSVAPPEPGCACLASGPESTSASSGTPGTWEPADSYPPETLADLQASSITASPATPWTAGQYVVLGDASRAHWDGDSWEAGEAPA